MTVQLKIKKNDTTFLDNLRKIDGVANVVLVAFTGGE